MIDARLMVETCDKCDEVMKQGERILIIAEDGVKPSKDILRFNGEDVRYACHLKYWDGVEEDDC